MERELEEAIGRTVDLWTYHDISRCFRDDVVARARVVYARRYCSTGAYARGNRASAEVRGRAAAATRLVPDCHRSPGPTPQGRATG
jgi:hypothetical protein